MNGILTTKNINSPTLDVDDSNRRVKIAIASMENLDRDQDIIISTAANKTIKERGPGGTNEIWHLIDHNYTLRSALGKFQELYMGTSGDEQNKLIGVNMLPNTSLGRDIWEHYKSGAINQHSITFTVVRATPAELLLDNNTIKYRRIEEIALWEGSAVLWGANPSTPTLSVGKSIKELAVEASGKMDILEKCLRSGKYSDEFFSLIELQIKSIKQYIADLEIKANQPSVMGTDTVGQDDGNTEKANKELAAIASKEIADYITQRFKL